MREGAAVARGRRRARGQLAASRRLVKGGGADAASDASGPTSGPQVTTGPDEAEAEQDAERVLPRATNLQSTGQFSALVVYNAGSMPPAAQAQYLQVFPRTSRRSWAR